MAYYHSLNQLMYLIGKEVCINRGKPGFYIGRLLSVQSDYLAIQTKDSYVIYYRSDYIVTLSESRRRTVHVEYSQEVGVVMANNFMEILLSFQNQIILLEYGGPEIGIGWLSEVTAVGIVMEIEERSVKIPLEQVRYAACQTIYR